MHTAYKFNIFL